MSEYLKLLDYWFHGNSEIIPKFWFDKNSETDEYIEKNYSDLLIKAENHQLNYWKSDVKGHLALIIVLDQFSRHIYRNNLEKLYKNDDIAYQYAQEFIISNRDAELTHLEKMMVLMPFRHQNDISAYKFVINYIKNETNPIWDNFKKHTLKNYEYLNIHNLLPSRESKFEFSDYSKFDSILENNWNPTMQTDNIVCELSTTLIKFCMNNFVDLNNMIIISLSGGVDSMVILTVLAIMKKAMPVNLLVVAVHIDYHNREETGLEAEFLFRWCSMMKIPLYYRYIYEGVRERKSKNREEYEELTKQIRFDLYKKVRDLYKSYNFMGVILGHHKGDLQENVFFNMMKGRSLTDLSVIKEQSDILGVKILRPLISHHKKDIFEIAHKNNIPYFKNTTPEWSNRGQYREIIQPNIIKTFGEGVLTNLSKISKESDELQLMIKLNIIDPYFKTIEIKDNVHYLPIIKDQPFTFWKYILLEWCRINNAPVISYKLLCQIYEKLNIDLSNKLTCNNNVSLTIKNNFIVITLR